MQPINQNAGVHFLRTLAIILGMGLVSVTISCSPSSDAPDPASPNTRDNAAESAADHIQAIATQGPSLEELYEFSIQNSAAKGFVDLDPKHTGISLMHKWNPPAKHRSLVSQIFGNGVAIGDYDNDGLADIYIANQVDAGRLYKNLGNMQFEDVTQQVGIDPSDMWVYGTTFVDINNDGLLDLYLCGQDCPNRLYINNGSKFEERAREFGLDFHGASIEMTFGDYDLDGDLDAYLVTNHLNRRRPGKPGAPMVKRTPDGPVVREPFKEFIYLQPDDQGKMRRLRAGQFDRFFRNDGGKFVDATEESGIGLHPYIGLSANWWDYNNDGWPDLYVANDYKGPDFLYRNNGPDPDGKVTFTNVISEAIPHTPWFSMGSDFGDINNDGRLDYMSADMAGTTHYRDKISMGNMSGPDSQGWFLNLPVPPQYMRNAVYLNTGTEQFMEVANLTNLAKTDWTWSTKFADFDNDGKLDVYFTNGMMRDVLNSDHLADLKRIQLEYSASGDNSKSPKQIDYEFWLAKEPFRLENMCFRNHGDLKFENVAAQWGLDHSGVNTGAAVGDLDNDGDLDLVITGFEERVRVYRNDMNSQKSIRFELIGRESNRDACGARVEIETPGGDRQTRYLSSSRGFMSTSEKTIHFGVGNLDSVEQVTIHWPGGGIQRLGTLATNKQYRVRESYNDKPISIAQKPVKMFRSAKTGIEELHHRERDFDDFARQPLLPNKFSQLGPGIAVGDVDGDGDDDLYIGGAAGQTGKLVENLGNGRYRVQQQEALRDDLQCEDMGAAFADFDADGDLDLYVVSGGVECEPGDPVLQDRLYLNDGNGELKKSTNGLPKMLASGGAVAVCDFDRDSDLDVFVAGRIVPGAYPEAPRSFLLENVGGKFEIADRSTMPGIESVGMVTGCVWSDFNGDNWSDLMLTCEWGPVRCFQNKSGILQEVTESAGLASRLGWYNSINAGDIDNDGDTDFVVGNFGLNTKYKANSKKPELLFYGDFEAAGRKRIVEAKYEGDICLPRRGLSCSSHAMPMVRQKKPTFHEFAISSLDGIYGEENLQTADRYEANSLESGVLINDSDENGIKFRFRSLPRIAQASPVFGCQLCDVDGDGNLDLYVVQNFFGPQRETGFFDGGISLLLSGDGTGNFEAVEAAQSGLIVTGAATSLVVTDLDGNDSPDFVVGKNDASQMTFLNQTQASHFHVVDLRKTNESAIHVGSKVIANYSDGSSQIHEIRSGEGYLSQNAGKLFIGKGTPQRKLVDVTVQAADGSLTKLSVAISR